MKTNLTVEEAMKELDGFDSLYEITKTDFELQAVPKEDIKKLVENGSSAFIDKDRQYIFINIGKDYFAFVGSYRDGIVLTKYPITGFGLSVNSIAKVLNIDRLDIIYKHLKILEAAGLVEKSLISLTYEIAMEMSKRNK